MVHECEPKELMGIEYTHWHSSLCAKGLLRSLFITALLCAKKTLSHNKYQTLSEVEINFCLLGALLDCIQPTQDQTL